MFGWGGGEDVGMIFVPLLVDIVGLPNYKPHQLLPLQALGVIVDRLKNDITRLTAVRALATVARSPLAMDLTPALPQALPEVTSFLRKANRMLRLESLGALTALVTRDGPRTDPAALEAAIAAASAVISDTDLAVAAAALRLVETIVKEQTRTAGAACELVLGPAMALVKSPLLLGAVLSALQALLVTLAGSGAPEASVEILLGRLLKVGTAEDNGAGAPFAAAQCTAALCRAMGQERVESTAQSMLATLQAPDVHEAHQRFALLALGEVGREANLAAFSTLPGVLTAALASENVAEAASFALGGVAAGNLSAYLPVVLEQVHAQAANPKLQYQLLRALNEVITTTARRTTEATVPMSPAQIDIVLTLLLSSSSEKEEECRAVVAECLGHLALLAPDTVLPALRDQLDAEDPESRAVAVTALKHAAVERQHAIDASLAVMLPPVLGRMDDEDVGVRRAAVGLLTQVVHNKPSLVVDALPGVLPGLFLQTHPNPALVRTVDLGPFKHKIDDGLELRKAAFECLGVLMARCYDRLDPGTLLATLLELGLTDSYDVKMRCHGLLIALAGLAPGAVTAALDRLVEPLRATLNAKVKADAVKQEVDRNEDMLRSCLRAVEALARLPGASGVAAFKQFMDGTVNAGPMRDRYAAIVQERRLAEGRGAGGVGLGAGGGPEAMDVA